MVYVTLWKQVYSSTTKHKTIQYTPSLYSHHTNRGVGNRIGSYFIKLAKQDMKKVFHNLPDKDLAYFTEGTQYFDDYVEGM